CSTPSTRIWATRPPAAGATSIETAPWARVSSGPGGSSVSGPWNAASAAIRVQGADAAVGLVVQLADLDRAQVGHAAGQHGVVVVQPPLAAELHDRVVRGPADHRGEDHAAVGERTVRIVGRGIAQLVGVAGGVRQVVRAVVLVHPRAFEVAARV